jgi:hypothetical protein
VSRRSLAALAVALLVATGCSSDPPKSSTPPGVDGVRAAKGDLILDVVGDDLVSPVRATEPLPASDRKVLEKQLQKAFDATVALPLVKGHAGTIKTVFSPDAAGRAFGPDRAAMFDEGFTRVRKLEGTRTDVRLTGLAADDGALRTVVAKFDWDVRSRADGIRIHRVGELTLVPVFGTWVVTAYSVIVDRTLGGATTSTTAVAP